MHAVILANTANMTREEWLGLRKSFIGGSDAAAILGVNKYKSAFQLWQEKTDPSYTPQNDNEYMKQGRDLEPYVAALFSEETGKRVRCDNRILLHPEYPFIGANIDRKVVSENAGLECKTTSLYNKPMLDSGEYPITYYIQCIHYLAVTGFDKWYLAVWIHQHPIYIFKIDRQCHDVRQDIDALVDAEVEFWSRYVQGGETPAPDGSDSSRDAIRHMYPRANKERVSLHGLEDRIREHTILKNEIKRLKKRQTQIEQDLQLEMGAAEVGHADGYDVRWYNCTGRRSLDIDALREGHPDINLNDYYSTGIPYRTFKIQEKKEA